MVLRLLRDAVWSINEFAEVDEAARTKSKPKESAEKGAFDSVLTDVDSDDCFN